MPTPIQSNQPSRIATPSFLDTIFPKKSDEKKNVPGITYSVAESQSKARATRSVPNIPSPDKPMKSSLLGLAKGIDKVIGTTTQSTSAQVEKTVDDIQEKEKQQTDRMEQDNPSSFNRYTIGTTIAATVGFGLQYWKGDRAAALYKTLPAILTIFSQTVGAVGEMRKGKIQAEEIQDLHDLGLSRDNLDRTQTSLSCIMEGLTKTLERYMQIAQQQADLIRQLNARG